MSNAILTEQHERSLLIRFSRPEIRNPLSVEVLGLIDEVLANLETRDEIARLVFTGTDNIFASGANLNEIAEVNGGNAMEFAERGQALMNRIAALPQETVAAVNGFCYGGALDLALACRRRIASPGATFCHPGAGLGIMTGWGGTQRLPRLVGEAAALEMFLTGEPVNADGALRIGLIEKISDDPAAFLI
jgi:enoyl-CoA hydratase